MSALATLQQIPQCPVTDETLHLAFVGAYSQLSLVAKRLNLDDLDKRAMENCTAAVEQIQNDFAIRLNHETDTYNALCDAMEELQSELSELSPLRNEIARIRQEAEDRIATAEHNSAMAAMEAENKVIRATGELETCKSDLINSQLALKTVAKTYDIYRRKNPERLHVELSAKDKEISGMRAERKKSSETQQMLQRKLNVADKEVGKERNLRGAVERQLTLQTALYDNLKERVDFHDGREDVRQFILVAKNHSEVGCYIYNYHFGLSIYEKVRGSALELADFHFQIRTAMMIAMDVVPGVWGNPIFECIPQLVDIWDTAINDELHERIMARLAKDFPKLHQRIVDAKAAPIAELPLPAKTLSALSKAGYETVQQIASELPFELTNIKGIGEQTAEAILAAVNSWSISWTRKNGDIENIRSNRVRSPQA